MAALSLRAIKDALIGAEHRRVRTSFRDRAPGVISGPQSPPALLPAPLIGSGSVSQEGSATASALYRELTRLLGPRKAPRAAQWSPRIGLVAKAPLLSGANTDCARRFEKHASRPQTLFGDLCNDRRRSNFGPLRTGMAGLVSGGQLIQSGPSPEAGKFPRMNLPALTIIRAWFKKG
jgi:hypothetical protein